MTKQNWMGSFDETWNTKKLNELNNGVMCAIPDFKAQKSFITTLRSTDRDNLIKEVEKLKRGPANTSGNVLGDSLFNQGVSAVIEKIKGYYEK